MTRVVNPAEYISMPRPRLDWLVPSYIPHPGLVLLIGEPKAGKSFLGLQVAMYVASGISFLNQPVQPAKVLYLQFDTSEVVWRQRLVDIQKVGIVLSPNLYFLHPDDQPTRMNILSQESQAVIADSIHACDPKLVVVDVLRECHSSDEQDSTEMKIVGDVLMHLTRGRTLLLIHHTHKLYESYGTPSPVNAARGSSYITGKADAIWLLHDKKLQIASRFHHDETREVTRLPSGLWQIR